MNTVFLLMAEFNTCQIELERICEKYLVMDIGTAKRRAKNQRLPFPDIREQSQNSPYLVNVSDLAGYLDTLKNSATKEWCSMN